MSGVLIRPHPALSAALLSLCVWYVSWWFCFCTSLTRLHPASHAPHGTADQMFHLALHQVWVGLGQVLGFPALVPACPTLPSLSSSKPDHWLLVLQGSPASLERWQAAWQAPLCKCR